MILYALCNKGVVIVASELYGLYNSLKVVFLSKFASVC